MSSVCAFGYKTRNFQDKTVAKSSCVLFYAKSNILNFELCIANYDIGKPIANTKSMLETSFNSMVAVNQI